FPLVVAQDRLGGLGILLHLGDRAGPEPLLELLFDDVLVGLPRPGVGAVGVEDLPEAAVLEEIELAQTGGGLHPQHLFAGIVLVLVLDERDASAMLGAGVELDVVGLDPLQLLLAPLAV